MLKYLSKVLYILTGSKITLIFLVCLFLFISLLDVIGIGLIGPFIGLATNPNFIQQNAFLTWAYAQTGITDVKYFIALVGLTVAIIFYVKSFFYFQIQRYVYEYALDQLVKIRFRLMHNYLTAPYTFHLSTNSSLLLQTITAEAQQFCYGITLPLLLAAANFVVLIALVLLLAITDLLATVSILLILLIAFLTYYLFKDSIGRWGQVASEANIEMLRIINHAVGGIKETRVIGCESYFETQFVKETKRFAVAASYSHVFQFVPRIVLEALLVTFVVGFTIVSQLLFNRSPESLISVLGVFAVSSVRLLPAASQFISSLTQIKSSSYSLNRIYFDLKELEKTGAKEGIATPVRSINLEMSKVPAISFKRQIVLDGLKYRYPNVSELALKEISLTLKKGQSIGLIGKSGAGKTTLVDVILGLLLPESGDIQVDGRSVYQNGVRSWQNLIGYIPQSIFLTDDTIQKNIAFGVPEDQIDPERLKKVIQSAQLEEMIQQLPDGLNTSVGERGVRLSGGQRQRIGIARALYHEREILVLDEATAALDNETERLVSEAIKSLSGTKTIIIIAHRLSTIKHCDCIYMMDQGRIVKSGSYKEVVGE